MPRNIKYIPNLVMRYHRSLLNQLIVGLDGRTKEALPFSGRGRVETRKRVETLQFVWENQSDLQNF